MKFSLIYPTQHRPQFIEVAIKFIENQLYENYEVIISDNYIDPQFSCEKHCDRANVNNLKYVRPPKPMSMVENWNYCLNFATGDYICYFTDKMFLLPNALQKAYEAIQVNACDIVTWVDNKFQAKRFPEYFGEGNYYIVQSDVPTGKKWQLFCPHNELKNRMCADLPRKEQSASSYARGKICFGAYKRELIERICSISGSLFHDISPDYTSMIFACTLAESAVEMENPGIIHVNTDLSNGWKNSTSDDHALSFLKTAGDPDNAMRNMLVPYLYSSINNIVSRDYLYICNAYNFNHELNRVNWLVYIGEDLDMEGRSWSSPEIESSHRKLLQDYIDNNLSFDEKQMYHKKRNNRLIEKNEIPKFSTRTILKPYIPEFLLKWRRKYTKHNNIQVNKLTDIIDLYKFY